ADKKQESTVSDSTDNLKEKTNYWERLRLATRRFRYAAEDWVYLCLLGCTMALISIWMDWTIERFNAMHIWTYEKAASFQDTESSIIAMF
ncbi:hypothetical protein PMAYCL1PPCAC_04554, partial [Pristionchus mayeri]